jgi:hypothetical protein
MAYQERAYPSRSTTPRESAGPWAVSFTVFAAAMMIIGGFFQIFQGIAAILEDDFFVLSGAYAFDLDVTTWGWIHLAAGVIIALAGLSLFSGSLWAKLVAISLAMLSMLTNFLYIPYYPVWSIVIIAINIGVIWAITNYSREMAGE